MFFGGKGENLDRKSPVGDGEVRGDGIGCVPLKTKEVTQSFNECPCPNFVC